MQEETELQKHSFVCCTATATAVKTLYHAVTFFCLLVKYQTVCSNLYYNVIRQKMQLCKRQGKKENKAKAKTKKNGTKNTQRKERYGGINGSEFLAAY